MAARIRKFTFSTGLGLALTIAAATSTWASAWLTDASGYSEANRQHVTYGKPLVVYFYVDWCPYCRGLETEILNNSQVESYLSSLPRVKINPEHGPNEKALARQFGVDGYPHFVIIPTPGSRPREISSWTKSGDRWVRVAPAEFVADCRAAAAVETTTSKTVTRAPATETVIQPQIQEIAKDGNYYRQVGESLYKAGKKTAALESFQKSLELAPGDTGSLHWAAYVSIELGRYQRGVGYLNRLIEISPTYGNGRAYYLRGYALAELGNTAKARADAQKACDIGHAEGCALARDLVKENR